MFAAARRPERSKHRPHQQRIGRRCWKLPCKSLVKCQHESDGRADGNNTGFLTFNWLRFTLCVNLTFCFVICEMSLFFGGEEARWLLSDRQPVPAGSSRFPRGRRADVKGQIFPMIALICLLNYFLRSEKLKSANGGR